MIPVALLTVFLVVNLIEQDVIAHTPGQPECEQFTITSRKTIDLNPLSPAQRKEILNTLLACNKVSSKLHIDVAYFRIKDWLDWTLNGLEVATLLGFNSISRTFIHEGANVNCTASHLAAWKGNTNMLRILLDLGADVNWKNPGWNDTPLYWAAMIGQREAAALLIERGADLNAQISDGMTSLAYAAYRGHQSVVALLLEKGADTSIRDNQGLTAAERANEQRFTGIANLINSKG